MGPRVSYTIEREIARFESFQGSSGEVKAERLCDFGLLLTPKTGVLAAKGKKDIALTLMGITHGNETAGIAVLNALLALLSSGSVRLEIPVAFLLGNPWAARENKRFLERDLNRSFNRPDPRMKEERRAAELSQVLRRTDFIVDFHQTTKASDRPFFIFPYSKPSFAFAREVAPKQTIVTHWGKPFSAEGMCSDEYVNAQGGTGISLELGQNGFDPYQIGGGVEAGLWALRTVADRWKGGHTDAFAKGRADNDPELYTWAQIVAWPERGFVDLDEGWTNFREVTEGQRLGTVDGEPLLAPVSGRMLFPKYLSRDQQRALDSRPTELCRIMKRIGTGDLPK